MKRLIQQFFAIFFSTGLVFGALPAGAQWDVRTGGSDANGGGFVSGASGTDWSQQNAAQTAFTDLVIGGTTTLVTSVAHPFGATDVGNIINIVSGLNCTTGRYQVVSVSVVTATIDRSAGTAASVCTANLGGSLLTLGTAVASLATPSGLNTNTIWLQSGTYTLTTVITWSTGSTISGYNATHGDLGTKPLLTTATNSTVLLTAGGLGQVVNNVSLSNTAGVRAIGVNSGVLLEVTNCIFDGFVNGVNITNNQLVLANVEVKNSTGAGIMIQSPGVLTALALYSHNNTGAGLTDAAGAGIRATVLNSIFALNGAGGMVMTNTSDFSYVSNSDFVSNTGVGFSSVSAANSTFNYIFNSIFYANTTYGISSSAPFLGSGVGLSNAFGANGTAPTNGFPAGLGDITLTANPFTSSTNFALNSTAGGGAALKSLAVPHIFSGGTTTSFLDIGAAQSSAPTAGVVSSGFVQ